MTLRPIIKYGNPILKAKAEELTSDFFANEKNQKLIDEMIYTMFESDGVGLAAPQIGESIRLIVIANNPIEARKDNTKSEAIVMINPEIISHSYFQKTGEEGCLSFPQLFGPVKRWTSVTVKYLDREGNEQQKKATGLLGIVMQHEIDHLDGILLIDRASKLYKVESM